MRLDEFYARIQDAGSDVLKFVILLAQADSIPNDDVDVQLSDIGWVEVDYEAGQARLYPRSAVSDEHPDQEIPTLEVLLQLLPFDVDGENNLVLVAELPLDRERSDLIRTSIAEVRALHLGRRSEEAWLLLNRREAFTHDVLPA